MRVGLIARCDNRGLGIQTWEVWRHLAPAVTVVVDPGGTEARQYPDRYPDGIVCTPDRICDRRIVDMLATCDVVYTAETWYDRSLPERLAAAGTATVRHINPELDDGAWSSSVWAPTGWLTDRLPAGTRVVPMPAPVDRFPTVTPPTSPPRVVHPAGKPALADRQGSEIVAACTRPLHRAGISVDLVGFGSARGVPFRPVDDWWTRDPGAVCSVIPRRYGGLCMPVLEALAAGVPVMMTDCPPNADMWPIIPLAASRGHDVRAKAGLVPNWVVDPGTVTSTVMVLAADPNRRAHEADRARGWALEHSWEVLAPVWVRELADAAETGSR